MHWPHQTAGVEQVLTAIAAGKRRICLTSPTGGGKTRMMLDLATSHMNGRVVLYTNRKLLLEQTQLVLALNGFEHGTRAAGYEDRRHLPLQLSSLPTETSRSMKKKTWELHDAALVLVDECHAQKGKAAQRILSEHVKRGAALVGVTATPIGIGHIYKDLVVAGTNSELRDCGALVPAYHYGPSEPDLSKIGRFKLGEDLSEKQNAKAIMVPGIFGRVLEWHRRLNPEGKPSILFAPGVGESLYFAEEFCKAGIPAAHIDGVDVFWNGRSYKASKEARKDVLLASKEGDAKVLCNRFVLREGIDAPWLSHGVFATVYGSLQSYLQSGGRLLRYHPGIDSVAVQDHGGNWWRHGSLNANRDWRLDQTAHEIAALREERLRPPAPDLPGAEPQPARCPRCAMILMGPRCTCGFEFGGTRRSRLVLQADGKEMEYLGEVFKPRRITEKKNAKELWKRMYYRARNGDMTFRQAEALFAQENDWGWPPRDLPMMPLLPEDWLRKVADVNPERLTSAN